MIYIKPKLKSGQSFFIIENDKVKEVIIESVLINSKNQENYSIHYLATNNRYHENSKNFFLKKEDAQDLIDNGLQINFKAGDLIRYATPTEIKQDRLIESDIFFKEGIIYNQTHVVESGTINLSNNIYSKDDFKGVCEEFLKK
jgi:hypothetical protein